MTDKNTSLQKATGLLKILAHPLRLSILCNLHHQGEMCVGDIVALEKGKASQSQISQFLAIMRQEKLVKTRRSGQTIHYRIASPEVKAVIAALYSIYCK